MIFSILSGLFVAWFLNLFGFYQNIFYGFIQPFVTFDVTIGFYYGVFVVIGLLFGLIASGH